MIIYDPFLTFLQGGRDTRKSFPPWGKLERGLVEKKFMFY
jgi:hypothetical protein